jgi:predicted exporter/SAM-dependent methyltransferase
MSYFGTARLSIDTDVTRSLPVGDPVIADAQYVMSHHPMKDRIVIDLSGNRSSDALVDAAVLIERQFAASGLFKSVGLDEYQAVIPGLITHIIEKLPLLFDARDLEQKIKPLIEPEKIQEAFADNYSRLLNLEGIGQSNIMAADPFGFKNIILARMAHLAPSRNVQIYRGHLLSSDGKHLLITAEPKGSATDTVIARKIDGLIHACRTDLEKRYKGDGAVFTLTPAGAFRAALDNEDTAKKDARMAVVFASMGIVMLLLAGFPRPFIGILAIVPAVLGTIAATFVYSLFERTISVLALGFGGTIISFTVDYGIAYLLFLDRPHETRGMEATKEVWGLGLLAMLTTALSFAFLFISGFSALAQIGCFTALGVVFTYIFVHTLFPVVFPTMPPAKRGGFVPLQKFVNRMMSSRSLYRVYAACGLCAIMLVLARPDFKVDLSAMNTVSRETLHAEKLITETWGNVLGSIYLMTEASSLEDLQRKGDRLAAELGKEIETGVLSAAFTTSVVFPGRERMKENLAAWDRFWSAARVTAMKKSIRDSSREFGFAPAAFGAFFKTLAKRDIPDMAIPREYFGVLGVHRVEGRDAWAQFSVLTPGPAYRADRFYSRVAAAGLARLFDPAFFGERLGEIILAGFIKMALIVGVITVAVALLYLLDVKLTLISMAPTLFSLICTLGTMRLLGQQPGIPAIIVTVIVIGMGTDYALYLVRAYQRYMDESHPSVGLIRLTVFLSAVSSMIGFGVLSLADHALLRNAGLTLFLGIGYSFFGTVLIVPPLLGRMFVPGRLSDESLGPSSGTLAGRVERRYRFMEPYPRLFARYKMKFDPMFSELHGFLNEPKTIVDVGTGYGVPATWLLERYPDARLYGIEPDEKRRRIASWAVGDRGSVMPGSAPELPSFPGKADAVLLIDMIHYLRDDDLSLLLERIRKRIASKGLLIIRGTVPYRRRTVLRTIEMIWIRMNGLAMNYRSAGDITRLIKKAGFSVSVKDSSCRSREEKWFLCAPGRRMRRG